MRPLLIAVCSILLATFCLGQTSIERPTSSPIYGPAPGDQMAPVAASNGTEFLVAWIDARSSVSIYATRVSTDGKVLDGTGIRIPLEPYIPNLRLLGAFWLDDAFTLVYSYGLSTSYYAVVARIDAGGNLIDGPRIVANLFARAAASNRSRIVIAGESAVAVLDDHANLLGITNVSPTLAYGVGIASNGSTFLLSTFSYDGTNWVNFLTLNANGEVVKSSKIAASGTGDGPIIGTDGHDYLVLYNDANNGSLAERVTSSGDIGASTLLPSSFPPIPFGSLLWTGDSYLLAGIGFDAQQIVGVVPLDRDGKLTSQFESLGSGTTGSANTPAIVAARDRVFVTWTTGQQLVGNALDVAGIVLDRAGRPKSEMILLATSSNPQRAPAIGTGGARDLVVWDEPSGIYAARLSENGSEMDGRGIEISTATQPTRDFTINGGRKIRIVLDGNVYLVAWTGGDRKLNAQRIDPATGALLGQRAVLAPCVTSFDLKRDDLGDVVFASDCTGALFAERVSAAGPVGPPLPISPPQVGTDSPRAAWNGSEWLVAYNELIPIFTLAPVPAYRHNVLAQRVSASLNAIDATPIAIDVTQYEATFPAVATDGKDFLVAWSRWWNAPGVYAHRINADGTTADHASDPGIAIGSGNTVVFAATWDGRRYAVEYTVQRADGSNELRLSHVVNDHPVDSILVTAENTYEADLAIFSTGSVRTAYARTAAEPIYGGVARVFTRDVSGSRQRTVRRW